MKLREVICASTAPSSAALGLGSITLHDAESGAQLASFKQSSATVHCTSVIKSTGRLGGAILCSQTDKSIMNVYNFQKEQLYLKIVLPEKLSCIVTDEEGRYCAGGTPNGRIYLWEMASGILFNSFEAHYRRITVIRFSKDGAALITGSDDSRAAVWSISRLLDDQLLHEIPMPYCTLTDHTLPVTDIQCGVGVFPTFRVMTSSMDNSCKLWDISSKTLLTTFLFPGPISNMAFDPAERTMFATSSDGFIHQVNLYRQRRDKMGHVTGAMEAVGGFGNDDSIRVDVEQGPNTKRLISAGQAVSSLTISLTGANLFVGTNAGTVQVYDIASHQLLRTITAHQGFAVTHVSTFLKPPDLVGQITLGSASHHDLIPIIPIASFHRTRDENLRTIHDVPIMLPVPRDGAVPRGQLPAYDFASDHRYFLDQSSAGPNGQSLQSRVTELEAELTNLRQNLTKAKGLNDAMWETVINRVFDSEKTDDETPGKKRPRLNGT